MNLLFPKGFVISLAGHLAAFSIFSFSFGKIPEFSNYNFTGNLLTSGDLSRPLSGVVAASIVRANNLTESKINSIVLDKSAQEKGKFPFILNKPQIALSKGEKLKYLKPLVNFPKPKDKSTIMFYPQLPQSFIVYFQDRQTVHIELDFNITSGRSINSIVVKRKISSGNLEADLLSARYISRYLFMQQARFSLNSTQTVKIDLSTKNQK